MVIIPYQDKIKNQSLEEYFEEDVEEASTYVDTVKGDYEELGDYDLTIYNK